ncbi:unnamed protein product [Arabidopsis thaliana]|uniref:Uncharacterized protein n=1 Tax=Arabidopsis thaliana TaxID=3702 RepID=A0A5S9XHB5_ARATH|nr:unnamed protein product [Arabidopsis thaliana]
MVEIIEDLNIVPPAATLSARLFCSIPNLGILIYLHGCTVQTGIQTPDSMFTQRTVEFNRILDSASGLLV